MLKVYNKDFDFKHKETSENNDGKTTAEYSWCFYLESNTCVVVTYDVGKNKSETKQHPMRETKEFGIEIWSADKGCWMPYRDEIQKSYSDYIAEKELLED